MPSAVPTTASPTAASYSVVPELYFWAFGNSTNITVQTTKMVASTDSSGTIYCNAFSSIISDPNTLKLSPFFAAFSSVHENITLTMTELAAFSKWHVYCAVVTKYNYVSSLEDVLSHAVTVNTTCCYSIQYTSSPSAVYGDTSKYSLGSTSNVFAFALSYQPRQYVSVQAILLYGNGSVVKSTNLAVFPTAPFIFRSSSKGQLSGLFYLSGLTTLNGTYLLSLNVSGPSDNEYYPAEVVTVEVLASTQPDSAPKVKSCRLSSSGASAILLFDKETNLASQLASNWPCSSIFNFSAVASASCSWVNSSAVRISSTNLNVGQSITLLGQVLRAACGATASCENYVYSSSQSVLVQYPFTSIIPAIVFNMPTEISNQSSLVVDATGTTGCGGRAWKTILWNITNSQGADNSLYYTTSIQSLLNGYKDISRRIVVPYTLKPSVYIFSLTVTNFLGQTSSRAAVVSVTGNRYVPTVQIRGSNSIQLVASNSLSVLALASLNPSVVSETVQLKYHWAISKSGTMLAYNSTSSSPTKFVLSAYSLAAGTTYILTLTVQTLVAGRVAGSSYTTASVYVASGPVVVTISGLFDLLKRPNSQVVTAFSLLCRRK
jgi:hypothetical protein